VLAEEVLVVIILEWQMLLVLVDLVVEEMVEIVET
jgi:hypothetical protein